MMIRKTLLTTLLAFSLHSLLQAQEIDSIKLDSYLKTLAQQDQFMGNVAISRGGKTLFEQSVGTADFRTAQSARLSTKYRIGSISKTFTAVMVLKAAEQGLLRLEQPLADFFPQLPEASSITLAHLLLHRSGIANFTDSQDYLSWHDKAKTESEMVALLAGSTLDFRPNSQARYSNSNYVLLSYILEKAAGKGYGKLLQELVCVPLGLQNTYLGASIDSQKQEARSYSYQDKWVEERHTDPSIPLGAGALVSTTEDLLSFSRALFQGNLLQDTSFSTMKTIVEGFGMGLVTIPFYEHQGYGHTGGIDGFRSVFAYYPADDLSVALLSNGSRFAINTILIALLSASYGKDYDIPVFTSISLNETALRAFVGVYSSTQLPLKMTIALQDTSLTAQATGQSSFPLTATADNSFTFIPADVVLTFDAEKGTMVLKQGGGTFTFTRE